MGASQRRRSAMHTSVKAIPGKREKDGGEVSKKRMSCATLSHILIISVLLGLTFCFWSFIRPTPQQLISGTVSSSVYDRGLVTSDMAYQSVLSEHSRYWSNSSHRHFKSSVLAYVTPWNRKGYDMAKIFRSKLTHVSPVWYRLTRSNEGWNLYGRSNADGHWMEDVRQDGFPLIVPRVVVEGWPLDILVKAEKREKVVSTLIDEIREMKLDGIVLEAWSLWRAHGILEDPYLRKKALEFVKILGLELHTMEQYRLYSHGTPQLIFVIPPAGKPNDPASFTTKDMVYLRDAVDGFSLMTYDYSSPYSPGPNAPLAWIRQCLHSLLPGRSKEGVAKSDLGHNSKNIERSFRDLDLAGKLLMGINFYGYDYSTPQGGGPIVGHEYISVLSQFRPQIFWDEAIQEHYLEYKKEESKHTRNRVYYPSLKSLSVRLREAETWRVGISIWEIGQGLEYFFDLL